MARYTGPTTRINRRFGMSIFPPNKAQDRKPHPPGQHGPGGLPQFGIKIEDRIDRSGLREKRGGGVDIGRCKESQPTRAVKETAPAGHSRVDCCHQKSSSLRVENSHEQI